MMRMRGLALLVALAVPAVGCGDDADRDAARKRAQSAKSKRKQQQAAAAKAKAAAAEDAAKNIFEFTEKPTFASIPDKPVVGRLRGKAFDVAQVVLEPAGEAWQIQFHDKALARPTALARGSHALTIALDATAPEAGKRYERDLVAGGALWRLPPPAPAAPAPAKAKKTKSKRGKKAPASAAPTEAAAPTGPKTWAPELAYAIEITRWDVKPYNEGGPAFQDAGRADGRVAIVMRGGAQPEAWVAGTFKDAVVRYMGKPKVPTVAAEAVGEGEEKGGKGSK